jgi:AcrR family transcriptional regulator
MMVKMNNKDEIVRAAILQAAERVFQKWGLNKTTMEDIAREAEKGKSTLYYYYKSKEEIFDAVAITEINYILSKAREATNTVSTAKEKIKKYIVVSINELKKYSILYGIVRREIKGDQKIIDKLLKLIQQKQEMYVKEMLSIGIQKKEFHFIDESEIDTAVKAIVGIIHALELYLLLENDDIGQIDMAAKLIAYGI